MLVSNRFNNKIDDDYKTFTRRFDALSCVLQISGRGVCTCTPLNLPRTGHTWMNRPHSVCLRWCASFLYQRAEEHKSSAVGVHFKNYHKSLKHFDTNFTVLRQCKTKFDCLVYEMLFIKELKPSIGLPEGKTLLTSYCLSITPTRKCTIIQSFLVSYCLTMTPTRFC